MICDLQRSKLGRTFPDLAILSQGRFGISNAKDGILPGAFMVCLALLCRTSTVPTYSDSSLNIFLSVFLDKSYSTYLFRTQT